MQFALYELAKNPEIQESAREEAKRVLQKYNGEISYECVSELELMGRIIDGMSLSKIQKVLFRQKHESGGSSHYS